MEAVVRCVAWSHFATKPPPPRAALLHPPFRLIYILSGCICSSHPGRLWLQEHVGHIPLFCPDGIVNTEYTEEFSFHTGLNLRLRFPLLSGYRWVPKVP